ncbi:Hypothetical predicted protein [Cloeon dipterum]|uniref:Vezatin n=1 Tax=Cloeon dipterum TaxID=197152 RepID=A0A8S1DSJ6_9INSE|nr:Hypothetical predicted protein [Cloeon dipterum]
MLELLIMEEEEDVIFKGGALHEHLINSGFSDFEVYDKNWSLDSTDEHLQKAKPLGNFFNFLPDFKSSLQKYLPAFYKDCQCYDKFFNSLLDSTIIRPEAEYWLRNVRQSFKTQNISCLQPEDSYGMWQSPFTWLVEKPLLVFFLCQGGVLAYDRIASQHRLLSLKHLLAGLESFNRKLGMAMHLSQQDEMSQRFLSNTFSNLVDTFVLKNSPNVLFKLVDLLQRFSTSLNSFMERMHQVSPLPAEFDCRHALAALGTPTCFSKRADVALRDLKDVQLFYKEVLTIFTHQLAMNFIAHGQHGGCKNIFPALQDLSSALSNANLELKQIIDLIRGVNLLKAPPKVAQVNGAKRKSYFTDPVVPAIESSGVHLKNALSFVLNSSNLSDSGFGHALQTLQASRMELAAADSFLHKAEILINRLSKSKAPPEENQETPSNSEHPPISLDLSSTLSEVGDPFLEEVYQGTSMSGNSLEWDDGEETADVSRDSANNTYYKHLMNELQCVLVSKGRSRIKAESADSSLVTPINSFEGSAVAMATSTPFVPARTKVEVNTTIDLDSSSTLSDTNKTIELVSTDSSAAESVRPTPKPRRSKYAAERMEQMTYVSPATLGLGGDTPKSLANMIAQRAQQMTRVEETFEDETVFEDAQDKTIQLE